MKAAQRWWGMGDTETPMALGSLVYCPFPPTASYNSPRGFSFECNSFYSWLVYENWQDHGPRSYGQGPWKIIGYREESISCSPLDRDSTAEEPSRPCVSQVLYLASVAPNWGSPGPGIWDTKRMGLEGSVDIWEPKAERTYGEIWLIKDKGYTKDSRKLSAISMEEKFPWGHPQSRMGSGNYRQT